MGRYCHGERSGTHGQCGLYGGVVFYTATCARLFYREFPLQNKKDAKDQLTARPVRRSTKQPGALVLRQQIAAGHIVQGQLAATRHEAAAARSGRPSMFSEAREIVCIPTIFV